MELQEKNIRGAWKEGTDRSEEASQSRAPGTSGRRGSGGVTTTTAPVVGSYVCKDFTDGPGAVLGKIVSYGGRLYVALYEDGRREELELDEISRILLAPVQDGDSDAKLGPRKRKLDRLISARRPCTRSRRKTDASAADGSDRGSRASSTVMLGLDLDKHADSSSDSCESVRAPTSTPASLDSPPFRALPLPPSSGDIGVPEESVVYLLSVYTFLRSFSHQLFLSPFGLDVFVGSLNCPVHNPLLDAVHISLMQVLRRHLKMLSSDGSQVASRCLRYFDWTLLDTLTWPVFLMEYLYMMGYTKGLDWKGFHDGISDGEYYGLTVTTKLRVLQILCDDVVESVELRAELEMRENMDEEREYSASSCLPPPEAGPMRVHPRYPKTSACKDPETLENAVALEEFNSSTSKFNSSTVALEIAPVVVQDGNCDECRLCGMDGTLICCDGCPSAYHSRCIGLNKALLPDGLWFCPECMANKIGPTSSKIGKGIRGAEVFGIDPSGRVFLGTCSYLLVLETSSNAEPLSRYYNRNDATKVLHVLCSTGQSSSLYADICKGISQYWEISLDKSFLQPERTNSVTSLLCEKEGAVGFNTFCAPSVEKTLNVVDNVEGDNYASNITQSTPENRALSSRDDCSIEAVVYDSLDSVDQVHPTDSQNYERENHVRSAKKLAGAADKTLVLVKDDWFASGDTNLVVQKVLPFTYTEFQEQIRNESAASFGSLSQPTDPSDSNQQRSAERSSVLDFGVCASGNGDVAYREDADSLVFLTKDDPVSIFHESRRINYIHCGKSRVSNSHLGAFFKAKAYVNQYILGDFAASAAANLAVLASEESKVSEAHASSNPRKVMSANIALQVKAFTGATTHFIWPSSEKKLMEVPREKCGWCIVCKGANTSKKGCLLNIAASNAIKGAARVIRSLGPIKNSESHFLAIAAHILHMEERLHGLIVGPLLDAKHNKQWRKSIKEASTCRVLKFLLLELERSIHAIAFSEDWIKAVDDWSVEFSATQAATCFIGPIQKRGLGRRQSRKQSTMSEIIPVSGHESRKHVQWWRGGKVSKALFQKGILPGPLAKKTARQGGYKGVTGIYYSESSEIPRRTRQFAWRAAVEMTKNASQLALQVRYLDAHVRWRDLFRPEQIPLDGKVSDNEASAFRNAVICDKRSVGKKTTYALAFGNQKHLPLRVRKNILETEGSQDEKSKLWFSENHVPLYLIKEFEEKLKEVPPLPSKKIITHCLPEFQRRQLTACRRDIFSYLMHKEEKSHKCSCASCQLDVLLRDAVRCNACQGYCHKGCLIPSSAYMEDHLEHKHLCNQCNLAIYSALVENHKETLKGQLSFQHEDQIATSAKIMEQNAYHPTQQPVLKMEIHSEMRPGPSDSILERKGKRGTCLTHGLIWKRKKSDECGTKFRLQHTIPRGNVDGDPLRKPVCVLCFMPYNPDLMYIRCEKCLNWVHADAVQLEEDQIFNLVGFKCCKCRRKVSPKCPYADPDYRKPERKPNPLKEPRAEENQGSMAQSVSGETKCKFPKSEKQNTLVSHTNPEELVEFEVKPLPFSVERVESVPELTSEAEFKFNASKPVPESLQKLSIGVPQVNIGIDVGGFCTTQEANYKSTVFTWSTQNLPVTSLVKHEMDVDGYSETQEANHMITTEKASSSQVDLDVSRMDNFGVTDINFANLKDPLVDSEGVNFEDMECEPPQTYFSFTELLASGDDQLDGLFDIPVEMLDNWYAAACQDIPCYKLAPCEMEPAEKQHGGAMEPAEKQHGGADEAVFVDGVLCQKCKLSQPSPDLVCETCGLYMHSQCSPWVETEMPLPTGDTHWRCGSCRDWR